MSNTAYQDLLKDTSESKENGDYFLVTITDLNPNVTYPLQFRWTYNDKRINEVWSAVKLITTPGESEPNTPEFGSSNFDNSQPEKLIITWNGTSDDGTSITNYDRVDVYIDGAPFDGTKVAYSFKAPGTAIIPAPAGTYQVALYAVSKTGKLSPVSSSVTKSITGNTVAVTSPETPSAPVVKSGLASVIIEWDGKKSDGTDLTKSGFAGARVYIGTSSGFTPSSDNWVHTLNFANGSNRVSIGVGSVINKSTGETLQYGTPYFVKIDTINANGTASGTPISASGNPVTVSKLPASEISTGILTADASITAGASGGARVVMSGASSPFIIYGTDGTTKLLEFIGGSTGTLSINGGGTFTGDLSAGSGSSIFKSDSNGIYLGNSVFASAPFSVSRNGVIKAAAGTVGGWTLGATYLQGSNLKLDTSGITVGATTSSYFDISPTGLVHRNANGTASGKFTLTLGASPQLTIDGTLTINGSTPATTGDLSGYATTSSLTSGLNGKINSGGAATDINSNTTTISGGKVRTGQISSTGYSYSSGVFSNVGMEINLDNGVIKAPNFGLDSSGNAYFKGSIQSGSSISGTEITGSTITTSKDANFGAIKLNASNSTLELVGTNGSIYGQLYQYGNGNEVILRHGSSRSFGYPSSSALLSLNPSTITLGYTDAFGISSKSMSLTADGAATFSGTVQSLSSATLALKLFRNISAGTTAPSGGSVGEVYIQY